LKLWPSNTLAPLPPSPTCRGRGRGDRVTFIILLTIIAFSFQAGAADRRPDKSRLTIATYNADFLFDGIPPEGQANFPWKNNPALADQHMRSVAEIIRRLNPDVINILEVENLDVLKHMNEAYLKSMGYKAYLVEGHDTYTHQNCGLLTRIDPVSDLRIAEDRVLDKEGKNRQCSKNYEVEFRIGGMEFGLIGTHMISRRGKNDAYREAQAEILRREARKFYPKKAVVILGDFNDFDGKVPDRINDRPTSRVLEMLKDIDPKSAGEELYNVEEKIPKAKRFSCWNNRNDDAEVDSVRELVMLDHILISKRLSGKIIEAGVLAVQPVVTPAADHYPVYVRLLTAP
jgi:endonuclease/exonuclease/phosphatase family metal-dependent hydrolase